MTKRQHFCIKFIIAAITIIMCMNIAGVTSAEAAQAAIRKTELVLVEDHSKDFAIDLKYATCDNFVQKTLYPSPTCVLTKGTLDKLIKANNLVKKQGFSIKIWDAYRPLSIQKIMWEATPDKIM